MIRWKKAVRREFISPILVLAASISGVKLACEEQVDASAGKGPSQYAIGG